MKEISYLRARMGMRETSLTISLAMHACAFSPLTKKNPVADSTLQGWDADPVDIALITVTLAIHGSRIIGC